MIMRPPPRALLEGLWWIYVAAYLVFLQGYIFYNIGRRWAARRKAKASREAKP